MFRYRADIDVQTDTQTIKSLNHTSVLHIIGCIPRMAYNQGKVQEAHLFRYKRNIYSQY